MNRISFATEWLDPHGVKGEELAATWASLKIEVSTGQQSPRGITHFYDPKVDSRRHQLHLSLYPLSEWLVFHWFQLLYGTERDAEENHDLRYAAGGYALPRLRFWSHGEDIRVRWEPFHDVARNLEFDSEGDLLLPRWEVEESLSGLLGKVVHRLEEHKISDTPLQKEWQSILGLSQGERDFCIAAASLGLDPFNLDGDLEEQILGVEALLSKELMVEFFPAASKQSVLDDAKSVAHILQELDAKREELPRLEDIRRVVSHCTPSSTAWQRGYETARRTRAALDLPPGPVSIDTLFQLGGQPLEMEGIGSIARIEGVVCRNGSSSSAAVAPGFLARRPDSIKFSVARLLCERLMLPSTTATLITREKTSGQKLNRAFAAELLAPADELRKRLPLINGAITSEDVSDLAEEFDVSSFVVENQIRNHRLAFIQDY